MESSSFSVKPVAPAPPLPVFKQLDVNSQRVATDAVGALMHSPTLPSLARRLVRYNEIDPDQLELSDKLKVRLSEAKTAGYNMPIAVAGHPEPDYRNASSNPHLSHLYLVYEPGANELPIFPQGRKGMENRILVVSGLVLLSYAIALIPSSITQALLQAAGMGEESRANITTIVGLAFTIGLTITFASLVQRRRRAKTRHGLTPQENVELIRAVNHSAQMKVTLTDYSEPGRVVRAAEFLMHQLTSTKAWRSKYLDTHHALFDPDRELAEIRDHASRINNLQHRLGPVPEGTTEEAKMARQHHGAQTEILNTATKSLFMRVAALYHYLQLMDDLSTKISSLERIEESLALAPELDELITQLGSDDIAMRNYQMLIDDAAAIRSGITAITESISDVRVV